MKVLIAGFGSIGRRHFRNLLALGEKDIVVYRTHHATIPDDELAGFPVESDLRAALAHQPDAAIISNPTALHLDVAIPAAQFGCQILIEKPISHSLARLDEFKEAVINNHCQVLVGFQFRFHPGLQEVKKLLDESAIGEVISARAHWGEYLPGWHPWEDYQQGYAARPELGGGVVLTLSHPIDYLRWLLGEVASISAFTSNKGLKLPVEDTAEINLAFKSGTLGSIHLDYLQRPASHTLEIIGTRGTLSWDNADGIVRLHSISSPEGSISLQEFFPPEGFERNWMFLDELRHFRDIVNGITEPVCTLQDGEMALRISLAARQGQLISFD
jgi:predicted dehydrogenase